MFLECADCGYAIGDPRSDVVTRRFEEHECTPEPVTALTLTETENP